MKRNLDLTKHKIWKDKSIKPEAKEIYAYLYSQGFNKTITHNMRYEHMKKML